MKAPFTCWLVLVLSIPALGQDHWARRVGAWSNDAFNDAARDASGAYYVAGEFGGNIDLGAATLISQGSLDAMVAKYTPQGALVWVRTFGGSGLDRAIKLELTQDGHIAVTGQFMGSVDFGGTVLASQGGTQDCFVLKMAQADGALAWVRAGGSANGVDQPNGVSVGPDGSIAVAGEFRGTAVFDQGSLTSMTDPVTGLPSVDIFLATYAADGTPQWLKHGAAEFADRGMDVEHDLEGNVYLTGQFTDTLLLDGVEHPNAMYSAIFIVRYGQGGAEEWFRVFGGGTYNQVFEMVVVEAGYLLLVGDVQGTVIFLDSEPDLFTAVEPRSSFLVKVGFDGELIAQTTWGSQYPLSTRALSIQGDDVAVLGRFTCQFTGFVPEYGESSFLATGANDLYVARFQLSDLDFKQAQQFGGQGDKAPGGIVHTLDEDVVFTGSFERLLVFPSEPGFEASPTGALLVAGAPAGYCADEHYASYTGLRGIALRDAFIAKGFISSREPYDPYQRDGAACDRAILPPVIRNGPDGELGPDSLRRCNNAILTAYTFTAHTPDTAQRHNAPDYRFLWSNGVTVPSILATQTGWYWVEVRIGEGCYTWRDSLYLTVDPLPPQPWVNDDVVVNTAAASATPVNVCEPDQPWLWATNLVAGNQVQWFGPGGLTAFNDSILAVATGNYVVVTTTPFGCQRQNAVNVIIHPNGPLPPLEALLDLSYPQDDDLDDTLRLCLGMAIALSTEASLLLNGQPTGLPYAVRTLSDCSGEGYWLPIPGNGLAFDCSYPFTAEGWYTHRVGFALTNAPCGEDTLFFTAIDSIYVMPLSVVDPVIALSGPGFLCPGDTVPVIGTCPNCTSASWTGAGLAYTAGDTAWVTAAGYVSFAGTAVSPDGCAEDDYASILVQWNPLPTLLVDPADAIICPDDSATIWTDAPGSQFQWFGPLGPMGIDNDTIATSQQGFYYLEMVDTLGCLVTSQPILLTDYATPFLNVLPDNVLCEPGETATLQVVTTSTASLVWEAPFAGSTALQQVVSAPGIYTCSVSACGITTPLSVEIFGNTANAELVDPGPFTLCPGEEVTLQAQPGQVIYSWEPGPIFLPQITVSATGLYLLVTSDANGCRDSLWTEVYVLPPYVALELVDTAFCQGDPLVVTATGDAEITWYGDAAQTIVLGTGGTLDLGTATAPLTIWVEQVVGQCGSGLLELDVQVSAPPSPPVIIGPLEACAGDSVSWSVTGAAALMEWTVPWGSFTGDTLVNTAVAEGDAGTITVAATSPGCPSASASLPFLVNQPLPFSIGPDTLLCAGGTAQYLLPAGFVQPLWHDGSSQPFLNSSAPATVILQARDANGCAVSDTALVTAFAFSQPMAATGATICLGADAVLTATGSGAFAWFSDAGLTDLVHSGGAFTIAAPQDSAVYYVTQSEWLCTSAPQAVALQVVPVPSDAELIGPSTACLGTPVLLELSGTGALSGAWDTPAGSHTGTTLLIDPVALSDSGAYTVLPSVGPCVGEPLTMTLQVLVPQPLHLGPDTVFCEGGTISVALPPGFGAPVWSTGSTAAVIVVDQPGTYAVEATDAQGCRVAEAITVGTVGCDPVLPNIITPNGDGTNDGWGLPRGGFVGALLRVYNRWGQQVWEGDPILRRFAGLHANGDPLPDGTYYYELLLTRSDAEVKAHTGFITLLR